MPRLALLAGISKPISGIELEVVRILIWKAIVAPLEVLSLEDCECFLKSLSTVSKRARPLTGLLAKAILTFHDQD